MKLAAAQAIAELAQAEQSDVVATAYGDASLSFGPDYLIPKPFDPRLIVKIAPAVAKAAMDERRGDAPDRRPARLSRAAHPVRLHSGLIMKPVFAAAKKNPKRVVFCEGEDQRVLHAVQTVVDEGLARPIVIGRPEVVAAAPARSWVCACARARDFELVNPNNDPRFRDYWQLYHDLMERKGVDRRGGQARGDPPHHTDRRADGAAERRRRDAVRHLR